MAITGGFLWLALRDAPFAKVAEVFAQANWPLLVGLSVPPYLVGVYLRALRWKLLTDPIQDIGVAPLFRAVAVGFMANNILPMRVGEVVRAWYLAQATGAATSAILGTVLLERVIDTVTVLALAGLVLAIGGGEGSRLAEGALWLAPLAVGPVLALVALRVAPGPVLRAVDVVLRPLPAGLRDGLTRFIRGFVEGLGALRGGRPLVGLAVYSALIWGVCSTLPILAGFWALGLEVGDFGAELVAAWTTLCAVALAVALPSAPGFFGPYHYAARLALEQFGASAETAVAVGTAIHAVFWLTLTATGLWVLQRGRTSLAEIGRAARN